MSPYKIRLCGLRLNKRGFVIGNVILGRNYDDTFVLIIATQLYRLSLCGWKHKQILFKFIPL